MRVNSIMKNIMQLYNNLFSESLEKSENCPNWMNFEVGKI